MRFETGIFSTACATTAGNTSVHKAPAATLRTPSRSPFSVLIICSSSALIPCFFAKPTAAGVQLPSFAFAVVTGGPRTSCSVSSARAWTFSIRTARRLAVASTVISPIASPCCSRPEATPLARALAMPSYSPAGSSSVPSSNKTV